MKDSGLGGEGRSVVKGDRGWVFHSIILAATLMVIPGCLLLAAADCLWEWWESKRQHRPDRWIDGPS